MYLDEGVGFEHGESGNDFHQHEMHMIASAIPQLEHGLADFEEFLLE